MLVDLVGGRLDQYRPAVFNGLPDRCPDNDRMRTAYRREPLRRARFA